MNKKILMIEDDEDISKVLSYRLKENNFDVVLAQDGIMAVQVAHQQKPDLILLDMMLPGGGGVVVLRNIRMSVNLKFIPVIVLTAMQSEEKKNEIEKMGIDGYFAKPYDFKELLDKINSLIKTTP